MTIYLYVKTHRKTGLKYLGKTEQDPYKYKGSGKYWRRHIKEHGYDVDTEVIRECQTQEEVRLWGLKYSQQWNIVESEEWANLMEESGDGWSSKRAREIAMKRVADGTHPLLGGEISRQTNLKRVADGTHHFLGNELNRRRVEDGTHHLLGGEIGGQNSRKRVVDGTHNLLGPEMNNRRVANGTHPFLGDKNPVHQRVKDGTHHLLNGEIQRRTALKRVENGTHNFLGGELVRQKVADGTHNFLNPTPWTCPECGKNGKGTSNFKRHLKGANCKLRK